MEAWTPLGHTTNAMRDPSGISQSVRPRLVNLIASLLPLVGCVEGESEFFVVSQAPTADAAPSELHVEIVEDAITVRAHGVTLESLLEEISLQSDLVVEVNGQLNDRISLDIDRLTLPEAVAHILPYHSYTLQYVPPLDAHRSRLWVFSSRSTESQALARVTFADGLDAPGTDDVTVRLEATQALAYIGGGEAAAKLADVVLGDGSPEVRTEAIYALSEVGGDLRVQVLEQALSDPDNKVREAAIDAFADIGGDESALALAFVLNDEDRLLRAEAVDALVAIGSETATRILEQALADQDSAIRDVAAEYLEELSP